MGPREHAYRAGAPVAATAFLAVLVSPRTALAQETQTAGQRPNLRIDIPTVNLTQITRTKEDGYERIDVPFLAEYINGIYQFGLYAGVIVAGVMAVVGGFEWLTSGDSGRAAKGKERIQNSVIGVVLLMLSYTILATVDPRLTTLRGLTINVINRVDLDKSLIDNEENTAAGIDETSVGRVSSGAAALIPSCPISLSAPDSGNVPNWSRAQEFETKIAPYITATDAAGRILQAASAAASCQVNLGSCGRSAGTIKAVAGIAEPDCDSKVAFSCWGRRSNTIGSPALADIKKIRCPSTGTQPSGCTTDSKQATARAYETLAAKNIPGWPDAWIDTLTPGDVVVVYNGNPTGTHSVIFAGWDDAGRSRMTVLHGSYTRPVKAGVICVRSTCPSPTPVVHIFKEERAYAASESQ